MTIKGNFMTATEQVKILLVKEHLTIKELAKLLSEYTGKDFAPYNLSNKMHRGTLRYDEVELIANALGYEIKIEKK